MNISFNVHFFIFLIVLSFCRCIRDIHIGILFSNSNPEDIMISRSVHLAFKDELYEDYFNFIVDDIIYQDPNKCGEEMKKLFDKEYSLIFTGISVKCYESYYEYTNQNTSIIINPVDLNTFPNSPYIVNGLFLSKVIFCIYLKYEFIIYN